MTNELLKLLCSSLLLLEISPLTMTACFRLLAIKENAELLAKAKETVARMNTSYALKRQCRHIMQNRKAKRELLQLYELHHSKGNEIIMLLIQEKIALERIKCPEECCMDLDHLAKTKRSLLLKIHERKEKSCECHFSGLGKQYSGIHEHFNDLNKTVVRSVSQVVTAQDPLAIETVSVESRKRKCKQANRRRNKNEQLEVEGRYEIYLIEDDQGETAEGSGAREQEENQELEAAAETRVQLKKPSLPKSSACRMKSKKVYKSRLGIEQMTDGRFKCPQCKFRGNTADVTRSHLRNRHTQKIGKKNGEFCKDLVKHAINEHCKSIIPNEKNLSSHMRHSHDLGKCVVCHEWMVRGRKDEHMVQKHQKIQCRCMARNVVISIPHHVPTDKCGTYYDK